MIGEGYSCAALAGKSVRDVVCSSRFLENLSAYWTEQREARRSVEASYRAMHKLGAPKGYRLPSHVVCRLMGLTAAEMASEFLDVLSGVSPRSNAEREYIRQLGMQAYALTVSQYIVDEHPELAGELLPEPDEEERT